MIQRLTKIHTILPLILFVMPLLLELFSWEIRESISDYAYSHSSNLLAGLLFSSALMYMYDGVIKDKWYNLVLGISLIGIALTPHKDYPVLHYTSAALFYIGNLVVMIVFSSTKQRVYKITAGIFTLFGLSGYFVFNIYSLLVAEWIGLIPSCLHFIGETNGKID